MPRREKTLTITHTLFPRRGIGSLEDGRLVEVKHALPGQKLRVALKGKKRGLIQGKTLEVLAPSPMETTSACPHFPLCGGCATQQISPEDELRLKAEELSRLYHREVPISRPSSVDHYRNKMEYTFGNLEREGELTLGLHVRGRFHDILPTPHCRIVHKDFPKIQEAVQSYFREKNLPFYQRRTHHGLLRHLVLRRSFSTGEILLNLVTTSEPGLDEEDFVHFLNTISLEGEIASIYHTTNDALGDVILPENEVLLFGKAAIEETLLGLRFSIGPFSFFQTNPESAAVLYDKARSLVKGAHRLYDLYSGTGTIGQILAPVCEEVIGVEILQEAVDAANLRAKENRIQNATFLCGDVLKVVEDLDATADVIVLDPPREGIHPKALPKILAFAPQAFLYISCNPRAQAQEIAHFEQAGYVLRHLEALDQFPRTPHVEALTLFVKER